jgi:hypothetical protein
MKTLSMLAIGVAFTMGCGTDSPSGPEVLPNLTVPDVPANGMQVITPIVHDIQPSTDHEICTWTSGLVDKDTDVRSTLSYQTEPGHHIVVFYTMDRQPVGQQRECTDTDMASFRFLAGNGGNGVVNEAPGNLVFRIPKGAQIVVQHHYLNATDEVLDGQSLVNLNFADAGGTYTPSGSTAFLNSGLSVQPGLDHLDISCTMDRTMKLWYFFPHMHRWGQQITVDVTRTGSEPQRLFDTRWDPEFTFHPPEMRNDPATPMVLSPGDKVSIGCTWNNDTGHVLGFGFEMCVAFGQFVDDQGLGNWACDDGHWGVF